MPHITNQEKLKQKYKLQLVSQRPKDGMWQGDYLKCPLCGYFVLKGGGYDECMCGNISVDSDMLGISVRQSRESDVEVYDATERAEGRKRQG
jgi:hypothetical protein